MDLCCAGVVRLLFGYWLICLIATWMLWRCGGGGAHSSALLGEQAGRCPRDTRRAPLGCLPCHLHVCLGSGIVLYRYTYWGLAPVGPVTVQ